MELILAFLVLVAALFLICLGTTWLPGYNIAAAFQKSGAGGYTVIKILDWDWAEEIADLETFHSGSGGVDESIAGKLQGRGSVHANYDSDAMPHSTTPGVTSGAKGLLKLTAASGKDYIIPVMILTVGPKGAVNGRVEFSFGYKLSGDAGTYVRPT